LYCYLSNRNIFYLLNVCIWLSIKLILKKSTLYHVGKIQVSPNLAINQAINLGQVTFWLISDARTGLK